MNLNEYQEQAKTFDTEPTDLLGLAVKGLGLTGEAGEVSEKIKKLIRDKSGELTEQDVLAITLEIGDTMWYAAMILDYIGVSFDEAAKMNIDKLTDRQTRNMIHGSGDNR